MPEDMPDRMPDRMPEDMSDRMPEDLPVTKCINVMVGITRSKVSSILSLSFNCVIFPKQVLFSLYRKSNSTKGSAGSDGGIGAQCNQYTF